MSLSITRASLPCLLVVLLTGCFNGVDSQRQSISELLSKNAAATSLELQSEQINRTVLYSLLPIVISFSFFVFIFYRIRREAYFKHKETELKLNISEIEMKALRAQMNPHFIFNCLNSVHHYMQRNDINRASDYLIKFSQLITLSDDLRALELYIQLEQLRMDHSFDYSVIVDDKIDKESLQIPSMIIQPFVENSIWHGLSQKGYGGIISIGIEKADEMVRCTIEDNGKRSDHKNKFDSSLIKKTSMGMSLIKDRLEMVSQIYHVKADFRMEDRKNDSIPEEGTRIILILPYEE